MKKAVDSEQEKLLYEAGILGDTFVYDIPTTIGELIEWIRSHENKHANYLMGEIIKTSTEPLDRLVELAIQIAESNS